MSGISSRLCHMLCTAAMYNPYKHVMPDDTSLGTKQCQCGLVTECQRLSYCSTSSELGKNDQWLQQQAQMQTESHCIECNECGNLQTYASRQSSCKDVSNDSAVLCVA